MWHIWCTDADAGMDPTPAQWRDISKVIGDTGLFPFFDMAYQGFASGDCDRDAAPVRQFLEDGHLLALSQSFAKNMGLYGERAGCFSIVTGTKQEAAYIESQLKVRFSPFWF